MPCVLTAGGEYIFLNASVNSFDLQIACFSPLQMKVLSECKYI